MQSAEIDTAFAHNASGRYTSTQERAMILWFFRLVPVVCLGALGFAYSIPKIWGTIVILATIAFLVMNLWQYTADLLLSKPNFIIGKVSKEIRKFKGPTRYDLLVGEDEIRLLALSKAHWQLVQADMIYRIYYAPRTRWLLSFMPLIDESA